MFLGNRNLPSKSTPVGIAMPVRCAVTSAAMYVCAKAGAAAKTYQPKNLELWPRNHSSAVNAAPTKI